LRTIRPRSLAAYLTFLTLYAIMLHANVDWSFGPLRNVIASPANRRWHHAAEEQAPDKNSQPSASPPKIKQAGHDDRPVFVSTLELAHCHQSAPV
jgi:hypothetical protein